MRVAGEFHGPAGGGSRLGWTRTQFKADDPVTFTVWPRRDGKTEGLLSKITGPDGREPGYRLVQSLGEDAPMLPENRKRYKEQALGCSLEISVLSMSSKSCSTVLRRRLRLLKRMLLATRNRKALGLRIVSLGWVLPYLPAALAAPL